MHQRGFLLNTGDAASLIEQVVVEIQGRPHMHQYASYMHIIATPGLMLLLCRCQPLGQFDAHSPRIGQESGFQVLCVSALPHGSFELDALGLELLV